MLKSELKTAMATPPVVAPAPPVVHPAPTTYPSNIPKVESKNIPVVSMASQPPDSEFKGRYKKNDNGEEYALAVVDNDPLGRTHKAKNSLHYWEGTAREFKDQFEVSDNDKRVPNDGPDKEKK